jgi:hypothetical protein
LFPGFFGGSVQFQDSKQTRELFTQRREDEGFFFSLPTLSIDFLSVMKVNFSAGRRQHRTFVSKVIYSLELVSFFSIKS